MKDLVYKDHTALDYAKMACDTLMKKFDAPDLPPKGRFHYHQGVFLSGMQKTYDICQEEKYYDYIKAWVDSIIKEDGTIETFDKGQLDDIQPGVLLYELYRKSGDERYKKALFTLLTLIKNFPKNDEGGFWHKEKYPYQMWRGLSKKVSKRNVFTPQTLSVILQDKLRAEASYGFECYFKEQLAEKKKGRNHDLSVTEYKVAQESRKLTDIKQQNNEEQEKNTKLRSNNASISYQIATQEQRHSRNLDVIAADEDRLETVRSSINAAETEYAKYADMIMDKKNNLELLSSKESELIERTKIAESVFDMFRQSGTDDVREKLIDVMYENQKLREENTTLKELLEKAYEFMKQFVIDGVNLLERFLESVGKVVGNVYKKTK